MKLSLVTYVNPPKPIEVKKLIENLVFLGLSRGKTPSKYSSSVLENIRSIIALIALNHLRISETIIQLC